MDLPLWLRIALFVVVAYLMLKPLIREILKAKKEMDRPMTRREWEARMIEKMCKRPGAWGIRK